MGFDIKKAAGVALPFGAGGLLGGLGGGSTPQANFGPQQQALKESAEKQKRLVTGAFGKVKPLTGQFQTATGEAVGEAEARRRALANAFKTELGQGLQAQGTQQFDQAKQQILGQLPELQRAAREGAAATGGLQRGAALTALQAPVTQAQAQLGDVAGDIALQSRQAQNQALSDIFQSDRGFELQKLGIDLNTAQTLLDTGRGDILNEAMQLAGIERQTIGDLVNLQTSQQESNLASQLASEQRKAALIGSLIGAGGSIAGGFLGGR